MRLLALLLAPSTAHAASLVDDASLSIDATADDVACSDVGTATFTVDTPAAPRDIEILIDRSGSVGSAEYARERAYAKALVATLDLDGGVDRVALVPYATGVANQRSLSATQTTAAVNAAIDALTYVQGSSYVKAGVSAAISDLVANPRAGAQRVVIILAQGNPNPSAQSPCSLATTLDADAITVEVVGVSEGFNSSTYACIVDDVATQISTAAGFATADPDVAPVLGVSTDVVLSGTLGGAFDLDGLPTVSTGIVTWSGDTFTWTIPTVHGGAVATFGYASDGSADGTLPLFSSLGAQATAARTLTTWSFADLDIDVGTCGPPDTDGDGVVDPEDAFPFDPDETTDTDGDGIGDHGDTCPYDVYNDSDADGSCDSEDACPLDAEDDWDADGLCADADLCPHDSEDDADADGMCGDVDACPADPYNDADGDGVCGNDDVCAFGDDRIDTDGDHTADACDLCPLDLFNDSDGDGSCDSDDACPLDPDDDADGDGVCGDEDSCPLDADDDIDSDGLCADVDPCPVDEANDADGDGICESEDNCPSVTNTDQLDADTDGIGTACEADTDGDGVIDDIDVCAGGDDAVDSDGDGVADHCDACPLDAGNDRDGDGTCDSDDPCPLDADDDRDDDGICADADACPYDAENDLDGDGTCGDVDACPLDPYNDVDGDGVCGDTDVCAAGDDGVDSDLDGMADACDVCPDDDLNDADGDGVCGDVDLCPADYYDDSDGDGACDSDDACPLDADDDADADGICGDVDACPADAANDADHDGRCESADNCDLVANSDQADRDHNGVGDACEPDSDGDGSRDDVDCSDTNAAVHPGAPEVCGDGVDNDCDSSDSADCDQILVTLTCGFDTQGLSFVDQSTSAGTQVLASVVNDADGVSGRVSFVTTNAKTRRGQPAGATTIGRSVSRTDSGRATSSFVACSVPVAQGADLRGRAVVWTPAYNEGSVKMLDMWVYGADTDRDGVSDWDEVTVACTDPTRRPSRSTRRHDRDHGTGCGCNGRHDD